MGYRELFLVLGATVLLSLLMMHINQSHLEGQEALQEYEIAHIAASVAQRFIEEGKSKKFDAYVDSLAPEDMPDGFTPWYALGHSQTESYPNFNDVDDYHNFSQTITSQGIDFQVTIQVRYVNDTDPELNANTETYNKVMRVTVTSSWLSSPLRLRHVFSYYGVK